MSITQPLEKKSFFNRASEIAVLIYQAIAIIAFIIIPISATKWWKIPFMGEFVEHSMIFNRVGPKRENTENDAWQLLNAGLALDDQLKEIDGYSVKNAKDIENALASHSIGDKVQITYENKYEGELTKTISLISFPAPDKITYFFVPYGIGLVFFLLSLWMSRLRLSENTGRAFIIFATAFSLSTASLFDLFTTHTLTILWFFSVALAGAGLLDLSLSFPQEFDFIKKYPYLRLIGYVIALVLSLVTLPSIYNLQAPSDYIQKWQNIYGMTGAFTFFFLGSLFYRSRTDKSPVARQQIKMVWWGILFSFSPLGSQL